MDPSMEINKHLQWMWCARLGITPMGRAGAGSSSSAPKIVPVEERIVATTPLLEALGNARTLRNDNSSRFGKFMRLFMADDGTLMGCKVR